jgi:hypothetical protein
MDEVSSKANRRRRQQFRARRRFRFPSLVNQKGWKPCYQTISRLALLFGGLALALQHLHRYDGGRDGLVNTTLRVQTIEAIAPDAGSQVTIDEDLVSSHPKAAPSSRARLLLSGNRLDVTKIAWSTAPAPSPLTARGKLDRHVGRGDRRAGVPSLLYSKEYHSHAARAPS